MGYKQQWYGKNHELCTPGLLGFEISLVVLNDTNVMPGVAQRRVVRSHTDKKNEQMLEQIKVEADGGPPKQFVKAIGALEDYIEPLGPQLFWACCHLEGATGSQEHLITLGRVNSNSGEVHLPASRSGVAIQESKLEVIGGSN
eukprot:Skav213339  [mRNA]  locus=scaffold3340:426716:428054:+ [translate_table: standard]